MPYKAGSRLSAERASKLGHLDVIRSAHVNELVNQFERLDVDETKTDAVWVPIPTGHEPLPLVFAVDGSLQTVQSDPPTRREVSFVKTALLRLDHHAISKLDPLDPHPLAMRDIMAEAGMWHATVFPLKGIRINGSGNNYDAVRQIIYDSFNDQSLNAEPYKTLKWLVYEKWDKSSQASSPAFGCPHCARETAGLPFDADSGACDNCGEAVLLTDVIGFHLEMGEDSAPVTLARAYMLVHETMLLFTGVRFYWDRGKFNTLRNCLFIKDGPLMLSGQYSKLVIPIRRFFEYVKVNNIQIHLVGQEKTGAFVDHLDIVTRWAEDSEVFAPSNDYIRREIQHSPLRSEPYGSRTNYGNKLLVNLDRYHHMVLSVPTGAYVDTSGLSDFVGLNRTLATLPSIVSHRHECALVPVELANGLASLSNYPSASILKIFADL